MTWRIATRHESVYRYASPVITSYNEARILPSSHAGQQVIEATINVRPATQIYTYRDYWMTSVVSFDVAESHDELAIVGYSVVDTAESPTRSVIDWEELKDPATLDRLVEYLTPTTYTTPNAELHDIAADLRHLANPGEAVDAVASWVLDTFDYQPGTTEVSTSAIEAFHQRSGVCQDFAHVTLVMLRSLGIPARYISGYTFPKADAVIGESIFGASHAWVEVWLGSWFPLDPTTGELVGERHVTVARGRDYADVAPFRGVYHGGALANLAVSVELTRLG